MSHRGDIATTALTSAALTLIALCIAAQWMIASGGIPRDTLLLERSEGQIVWTWGPIGGDRSIPVGPTTESGGILLVLPEASSSIVVLLNGEAVADFGYKSAAVVVHRGDLVEIDTGQGPWGDGQDTTRLEVEIADTTPNIRAPRRGARIRLSPGRTAVANIVL